MLAAVSLHPIEASALHARRERVFLVLAGTFLGTLAMLNILGILRFIKLGEIDTASWGTLTFAVAVGVRPYPVTFRCPDLLCDLYGTARASGTYGTDRTGGKGSAQGERDGCRRFT